MRYRNGSRTLLFVVTAIAMLTVASPDSGFAQAPKGKGQRRRPAQQMNRPGQNPGPAPAPAALPTSLDQAYATIIVNDIPALIERVGAIGAQIDPAWDAAHLRALIGAGVQDPELAGFAPGTRLAMVLFPNIQPATFVQVTPERLNLYANAIGRNDHVTTAEGLLILGNPELGVTFAPQVKRDLLERAGSASAPVAASASAPVVATVYVSRILADNGPRIQNMITALPMMMAGMQGMRRGGQQNPAGAQKMARVLEMELRALYAMGIQIDTIRIDTNLTLDGAQFEDTFILKPDTPLARLAAAPASSDADLMKMLSGQGALRGVVSYDAKAMEAFIGEMASAILGQMNIAGPERDAMIAFMKESMDVYGNGYAMNMILPGQPMMSGAFVSKVDDPAAALAQLESMNEKMKASGMAKFYEDMGMTMKMELVKNTRDYQGVPIHLFRIDQQMANMPPGMSDRVMAMIGKQQYEVAFVNGLRIFCAAPQKIEPLIDAAKSKKAVAGAQPLASRSHFKPGGKFYLDLGIGQMIGLVSDMVAAQAPAGQTNPLQPAMQKMANAAPVEVAGYSDRSSMRLDVLVPVDFIASAGQAIKEIGPQGRRGQGPGVGPRTPPGF